MSTKKPDIVEILDFWQGRDDTPLDLQVYLSIAADEIRGLRSENEYYRKLLDEAEPRF